MHSEYIVNASSKQNYKAMRPQSNKATKPHPTGLRYSVFPSKPAKLAKRRVSGWVMKKLQKGAWPQKLIKQAKAARACFRRFFAAPTPSAALAHHLGKFPRAQSKQTIYASSPERKSQPANGASSPRARRPASHLYKVPKSAKLTHQLQPTCSQAPRERHRLFTGRLVAQFSL